MCVRISDMLNNVSKFKPVRAQCALALQLYGKSKLWTLSSSYGFCTDKTSWHQGKATCDTVCATKYVQANFV